MKNKILVFIFIFSSFFNKFILANPYTPYSHQWNAYQQQLYGAMEEQKKREAEWAAQQEQIKKQNNSQKTFYELQAENTNKVILYKVFVYNSKTGEGIYDIVEGYDYDDSIKIMKKVAKKEFNLKCDDGIAWGGTASRKLYGSVAMGIVNGRYVAYYKHGGYTDEERDRFSLEKCQTEASNCEIIISNF